jgi:hypothetical protein
MERGSRLARLGNPSRGISRLTTVVVAPLVIVASLIGQGGGVKPAGGSGSSGGVPDRTKYDSGDPGAAGFGAELDAALLALLELKGRKQALVLAKVKAAVGDIESPLLHSMRELAAAARKKFKPRRKAMTRRSNWKERRGGDPEILEGLRFPVANQYMFGHGTVTAVDAVVGQAEIDGILARVKGHKKRKRSKKRRKGLLEAPAFLQVRAMLRGNPPDLDLCVAEILRELDTDRRADTFSVFLEGWRNGAESFYRALDRTAGTEDSVFFFDAMLGEYISKCVPKSHPDFKKIRRSTDAAHDCLHATFLSYRQYRALRECVALAMVMPPDALLPGSLARYEKMAHKGYSVRDLFTLFLSVEGQDIRKVLDIVTSTAPPLPDYLWTAKYEPFTALHKAFDDRLPKMTAKKHSDLVLKEQRASRAKMGRDCAAAARKAFLAAMAEVRK